MTERQTEWQRYKQNDRETDRMTVWQKSNNIILFSIGFTKITINLYLDLFVNKSSFSTMRRNLNYPSTYRGNTCDKRVDPILFIARCDSWDIISVHYLSMCILLWRYFLHCLIILPFLRWRGGTRTDKMTTRVAVTWQVQSRYSLSFVTVLSILNLASRIFNVIMY